MGCRMTSTRWQYRKSQTLFPQQQGTNQFPLKKSRKWLRGSWTPGPQVSVKPATSEQIRKFVALIFYTPPSIASLLGKISPAASFLPESKKEDQNVHPMCRIFKRLPEGQGFHLSCIRELTGHSMLWGTLRGEKRERERESWCAMWVSQKVCSGFSTRCYRKT